jgi:hypothetical protein
MAFRTQAALGVPLFSASPLKAYGERKRQIVRGCGFVPRGCGFERHALAVHAELRSPEQQPTSALALCITHGATAAAGFI